ncbi:porin [Cereibacter sediminicola]|uniref:porin n=1 Tax=Cereibacter sediminicola TaxID=2584941 RepID=UPI0011A176C7|nr:porin [Cereibacter sediminicola]
MKQILLATTALVMTAGVAAAEISFSGYAEMGVVGGGDDNINFASNGETQFHNDFDLKVTATSETDTGLAFGVSVEISKDEGRSNGNFSADNEAAFISGAFGTLTMGEIDGAVDWAITENVGNPGSIGDDETMHAGYMGAFGDGNYDNQIARYDYSFGDFGVAISAELDDSGENDDGYAVGMKYRGDFAGFGLGLGLGYQSMTTSGNWAPGNLGDFLGALPGGVDMDIYSVSLTGDFNNGFVAGVAYTKFNNDIEDFEHLGVSAGYTIGAFQVGANYGEFDLDGDKAKGYGIAAAYDLGGGLKLHGGYGDSDIDGVDGDFETYSVGVSMSF